MARATTRRRRPRSRTAGATPSFSSARRALRVVLRPELIGTALVVLAAATIPPLLPLTDVFRDARDELIEALGLNVVTGAILIAGAGALLVLRRAAWLRRRRRHLIGVAALLVFAAGLLGRWYPDTQIGAVDLRLASAGGDTGRWLTSGPLPLAAWLGTLLAGFVLVWPRTAREIVRRTPDAAVAAAIWLWSRELHRAPGRAALWLRRRGAQTPPPSLDPFESRRAAPYELATIAGPPMPSVDDPAVDDPAVDDRAVDDRALGDADNHNAAEIERSDRAMPSGVQMAMDMEHDVKEWRRSGDGWQLPPIALLDNDSVHVTHATQDNERRAQLIVETLASFGVDAQVTQINEGPTVTQFGVEPGWDVRTKAIVERDANGSALLGPDGQPRTRNVEVSRTRIRVNRITTLQNDLALALAAPALRIEAPVPGKSVVGIEVPNTEAAIVTLRSVLESKTFAQATRKAALPIALGYGVSGEPEVADLAEMPHLLIAGATGSGKSVCLNAVIVSLLMNYSPEELRLVLVDPKRVELTAFAAIPHLAFSEIVVDMDRVVGTLQAVINEMESRYRRFAKAGVRNIRRYNEERAGPRLAYWVVIIDELADLMLAAPYQVEHQLVRLAQLARATGIHLVVATQRPSVDVITGLIKANFPTRIAFAVASHVDSRTILDGGGAEKLLGRGDMLYVPTDRQKPLRLQGVYVSDSEIEAVVDFWTSGRFADIVPEKLDAMLADAEQQVVELAQGPAGATDATDPMLTKATELAREHTQLSTSLLQRRLRVGYPRAARLMDELEDRGIVGAPEGGSGSRPVLIADDEPEDAEAAFAGTAEQSSEPS